MFDKYEKIRRAGLRIFGIQDLAILLSLKIPSARVIANRLARKGIVRHLKRDLYLPAGIEVPDFEIANRLLSPSYVSFESALNYWGVTTQIPEIITSASRRSKRMTLEDREFLFSRIPAETFPIGIVREKTFFVARPEKALLDMIYHASIHRRSVAFDELFLDRMNQKTFRSWLKRYPLKTRQMAKRIPWT